LRFGRAALIVIAITLIGFVAVWWFRIRRVPTLRFTLVLGKGAWIDVDWIDLRQGGS
jgi:hypothetical protein